MKRIISDTVIVLNVMNAANAEAFDGIGNDSLHMFRPLSNMKERYFHTIV